MAQIQTADVTLADPGYTTNEGSVHKSIPAPGRNDTVTVDAFEDGDNGNNAVVVFKVNCDGRATASVTDGEVMLYASGSGVIQYLELELTTSDPNNWTVYLKTSGGSSYTFTKGRGGAGR